MKNNKSLNYVLLFLKILIIFILCASTVFYVWGLIDAAIESANMESVNNQISIDPLPLTFALFLVLSLITNGVSAILALVGLILSLVFRTLPKRKKNIIFFSILFACPFVLEILFFVAGLFF